MPQMVLYTWTVVLLWLDESELLLYKFTHLGFYVLVLVQGTVHPSPSPFHSHTNWFIVLLTLVVFYVRRRHSVKAYPEDSFFIRGPASTPSIFIGGGAN